MSYLRKAWLDDDYLGNPRLAFDGNAVLAFREFYPMLVIERMQMIWMRQILAGDWVPIKLGGRQMYEVWRRDDVRNYLKEWNKRVARKNTVIPPLPLGRSQDEILALADELVITQQLDLALPVPRMWVPYIPKTSKEVYG